MSSDEGHSVARRACCKTRGPSSPEFDKPFFRRTALDLLLELVQLDRGGEESCFCRYVDELLVGSAKRFSFGR